MATRGQFSRDVSLILNAWCIKATPKKDSLNQRKSLPGPPLLSSNLQPPSPLVTHVTTKIKER